MKKEAELYVKREQLLESIKKNIEFFEGTHLLNKFKPFLDLHLGSPQLENLEISSGAIGIAARRKHEEFLERLEEERILYADLNFNDE